jgi:hypothetical protein
MLYSQNFEEEIIWDFWNFLEEEGLDKYLDTCGTGCDTVM